MSVSAKFNSAQIASLREAVARNPAKVREETQNFLVRGVRVYNESIIRAPWRVGEAGGGAPVAKGNMRDTHVRNIGLWEAIIYPTAFYAVYVHEGTKRMKARPWLDYAQRTQKSAIEALQETTLSNITADLAK